MVLCLAAATNVPLRVRGPARTLVALWSTFAFAVCVAAPPLFTVVALLQWHQRDPTRIEAAVAPVLRPDDRAFIEPAAFYACAGRIDRIYDDHYAFSEEEAGTVTVMITDPGHVPEYQKKLGGRWLDTGAELITRDEPPQFPLITYILLPTPNFRVYRRAN
jgi:hypothetical protein